MTAHDHWRRGAAVLLGVVLTASLAVAPAALADEPASEDMVATEVAAPEEDGTDGDTPEVAEPVEEETPAEEPTEPAEDPETPAEEDPAEEDPAEEPAVTRYDTPVPAGDYYISTSGAVRRVLDVKSGSTANRANVQLYETNLSAAQRWRLTIDGETGLYTITCVGSGKVLDVASGSTANRTNIQQYASNGTAAQQWQIVDNGDGTYTIKSALSTDERAVVLDCASGSTASGTNVQLYTSNGTAAQKWTFTSTTAPTVGTEDASTALADGWYTITSALNGSYGLDVASGSASSGANVQLYKSNGSLAQSFKLVRTGSFYTIQPGCSTMRLDAANGNFFPGTNVRQAAASGGASQQWKLVQASDGAFSFINRATGTALEVTGSAAANGTNIQVNTYTGAANQRFSVTAKTEWLSEGLVTIKSALGSSTVLDAKSGGKTDGTNVQLYGSNNTQAQKWQILKVSGKTNTYQFRNVNSGKYLCLDSGGNVCLRGSGATQWTVEPNSGGYALVNTTYNKALDVAGAKTANGTNVQGYASNGTAAQRFTFPSATILANGTYAIKSAANGSIALDVKGASTANKANVQAYAWNNTGAQKWKLTRNSDGTYTVVNCVSGKALDVAGGTAASGTNVWQYTKNGSAAQKWHIADAGNGTFYLESALNRNLVLGYTSASNGGNAQLVAKSTNPSATAQRFTFTATTYNPIPMPTDAMGKKAWNLSSATRYLIMVDRANCRVGVYQGSMCAWQRVQYWTVSVGAPGTATVSGTFTVGSRGYSFGHGYTCYYWTQFYGDYLFHSVLYNQGTRIIQDGRLGYHISHGCVRMDINAAKWIYDNVPTGTKVVVY